VTVLRAAVESDPQSDPSAFIDAVDEVASWLFSREMSSV
jgi:hypothetical protein